MPFFYKMPTNSFREARAQGAFVFWNHPNWTAQRPDGLATLTDMHRKLIADGQLHGIEVVNDLTFSDEAFQLALDNNLTIMGTSDIHDLVDWQFNVHQGGHRPVTLVLAADRSPEGIREALLAHRTVVFHNNTLAGRPEHLQPLLAACVRVEKAAYEEKSAVLEITLRNLGSADLLLENQSPYSFHQDAGLVDLHAHSTAVIQVKTREHLPSLELSFDVLNAYTAPRVPARILVPVQVK
jgi:3',5'-nucleoside bisphosphate phosphatase